MYSLMNGLNSVRGTYVHPEVLPHIALWCGINIDDSEVVQQCQTIQNQIKREKASKSGYIYVLSAPMFSYYGANVYKIG